MSREWAGINRSDGWVMRCDAEGCLTASETRPDQSDLPLIEFATAGWFIAETHGDRCPSCVKRLGGMTALIKSREHSGACAPHPLMRAPQEAAR